MNRFHVKKGDQVVVISGTERGKRGKIIEVLRSKQRVIVEGAKMIKRHMHGRAGFELLPSVGYLTTLSG